MSDPRAYAPERLVPPDPLPFVSRKSLRRVKNPLPVPETCRYCGPKTPVFLVNNSEVYGREYGDWPYMYLCENCDSYVGLHPNTDIPLGPLASKELREARKASKKPFLRLQHLQQWSRKEAYTWLSRKMGLPLEETHFGWFEVAQCEQAEAICTAKLDEVTTKSQRQEVRHVRS